MNRVGEWMQTFTGRKFWPLDPRVDEIFIEDIAHSLSHQCRFAGHCRCFYSVSQHSVLVASLVPPGDKLWALLHDASEAYLVDLPRPVKRDSVLGTEYKRIEDLVMRMICDRFLLPHTMPATVHAADNCVLMTEKRDLMGPSPGKWTETALPMSELIVPASPALAEQMFLDAVYQWIPR